MLEDVINYYYENGYDEITDEELEKYLKKGIEVIKIICRGRMTEDEYKNNLSELEKETINKSIIETAIFRYENKETFSNPFRSYHLGDLNIDFSINETLINQEFLIPQSTYNNLMRLRHTTYSCYWRTNNYYD